MTDQSAPAGVGLASLGNWIAPVARRTETIVLPVAALLVGFAVFSLCLLVQGKSPVEFFALVHKAGFGTAFSWQNTLSRTAPLLFASLCVALPARLGLVVIGGEGAIVLGGVTAGAMGVALAGVPWGVALPLMAAFAMLVGGLWIGALPRA